MQSRRSEGLPISAHSHSASKMPWDSPTMVAAAAGNSGTHLRLVPASSGSVVEKPMKTVRTPSEKQIQPNQHIQIHPNDAKAFLALNLHVPMPLLLYCRFTPRRSNRAWSKDSCDIRHILQRVIDNCFPAVPCSAKQMHLKDHRLSELVQGSNDPKRNVLNNSKPSLSACLSIFWMKGFATAGNSSHGPGLPKRLHLPAFCKQCMNKTYPV